jgi:hypothetical protein
VKPQAGVTDENHDWNADQAPIHCIRNHWQKSTPHCQPNGDRFQDMDQDAIPMVELKYAGQLRQAGGDRAIYRSEKE